MKDVSKQEFDTPHPAHCQNGVAYIRFIGKDGQPTGYLHYSDCYAEGDGDKFHPLRFSSFNDAHAFLLANPQWEPALVMSVDPAICTEDSNEEEM